MSPEVSFVVATMNCGRRVDVLRRTAELLSRLPCELCITDGGSTDNTLADLSDLTQNVRVVRSGPDRGIYDAWSQALPHVRGRYIGFIGIDDQPRVEFIAAAIARARQPPCPAFIYGDILLRRGDRVRSVKAPARPLLFTSARPTFDVAHQGCLTRADLFDTVGAFDPTFRLAGDLDFLLRAREQIVQGGWLRLPQVQADVSEEGVSRSARAFSVYASEYARIEASQGITLGYSKWRLRCLSVAMRIPGAFAGLKQLSWLLRAQRHRTS